MNVTAAPLNLSGWQLLFYDEVEPFRPHREFMLPADSLLGPGQLLTVRELGAPPGVFPNFQLGVPLAWSSAFSAKAAVALLDAESNLVILCRSANSTSPR
jgi:hypothetical protein